jgi:alkylated DNA repair dioxygenase AlkB
MEYSFDTLLTTDGVVRYWEEWMSKMDAQQVFRSLHSAIDWKQEEVTLFGKKHILSRLTAWYGDRPFPYSYSGKSWLAQAWTSELQALKNKLEQTTGETFNSCLLNFYHNGSESMGWHSDNEASLVQDATIASISIGASRTFCFKHRRNKTKVDIELGNGSLLLMEGALQQHWLHALPKRLKIKEPRINLTFRKMKDQ